MIKWPDREAVLDAACVWARDLRARDSTVERIGCVGSYARGDWGVGSDVDVVVLLRDCALNSEDRYGVYYPEGLPVPADLWVYTRDEWAEFGDGAPSLRSRLEREWVELG